MRKLLSFSLYQPPCIGHERLFMKKIVVLVALLMTAFGALAKDGDAENEMVADFVAQAANCKYLEHVINTKSIEGLPKSFVIDMDETMDEIWEKGESAAHVMTKLAEICRVKIAAEKAVIQAGL